MRYWQRREIQALTVCDLASSLWECGLKGLFLDGILTHWSMQINIHMQSKNLPLIVNLAGPKGASAVVRKPVLWMSGTCIPSSPSF